MYKSIQLLSDTKYKFEIIFCINGFRVYEIENQIKLIINEIPRLNIKTIIQESNSVGKPLALYMQILFYPNVIKIKSGVRYRGVTFLKDYFTRLFRLIEGDHQDFKNINKKQLKKYFSDLLMKRKLDFNKIIRLKLYFLFCFICYRAIKLLAFLLQPIFFNKYYVGWKRTNR